MAAAGLKEFQGTNAKPSDAAAAGGGAAAAAATAPAASITAGVAGVSLDGTGDEELNEYEVDAIREQRREKKNAEALAKTTRSTLTGW